jgi:hypothetical protein
MIVLEGIDFSTQMNLRAFQHIEHEEHGMACKAVLSHRRSQVQTVRAGWGKEAQTLPNKHKRHEMLERKFTDGDSN